jgi:putative redox protein
MKVELSWSDKMLFRAHAGDHQVDVDARPPIGTNQGMSPKELLLSALVSCTAMDVVSLLKKNRQKLDQFKLTVDAPISEGGHPKKFTKADLTFDVAGEINPAVLLDSVKASQTKFCGVSAMLSRAFPIAYSVVLNGTLVGQGVADFDGEQTESP